jgi:replicative DNA helicase
MLDGSMIGHLMVIVTEADFYDPRHALLWEVFRGLAHRDKPIDIHTITAELRARERLNTVGGAQYLGELTDTIAVVAHCEHHARLLADYARARRVREAYSMAIMVMDRGGNPAHYVADAVAIARRSDADKATRRHSMIDHVGEAWTRIESAIDGNKRITPTGFAGFDGTRNVRGVTGGMHPSQLWVLAADQGFGKTAWALQVARYVATTGRVAMVFSLEMSGDSLALRMACGDVGVSMQDAVNGRLGQSDLTRLMAASNEIANIGALSIHDEANTMEEIEAECYSYFARFDVSLIVIDYAQIVRPSKDDARKSTVDQISAVSQGAKRLARRGKCPVLLLSQFSREGQKQERKPVPRDLKGSGSLESDADVIVFLWQERGQERQMEEHVTALVAKNRMGDVGDVPLVFQRHLTRFAESTDGQTVAPAVPPSQVQFAPRRRPEPVREIGEVYIPLDERGDLRDLRDLRERPSPRESMVMDAPRVADEGEGLPDCDGPAYIPPSPLFDGIEDDGTSFGFDAVGDS